MPTEIAQDQPKAAEAPRPRRRLAPILVVLLIMAVEGIGVFFVARSISSDPAHAVAAANAEKEHNDHESQTVEIDLADCRPSNSLSGKFLTFQVRVSALVSKHDEERARALVQEKQVRLQDAVNVVFRSLEPVHLKEPGLETLRRKLKHEFDRVLADDGIIKQVLIPQLLQSGPGV